MERYLIDTNVISGFFSDSFSEKGLILMESVFDAIPNISVITQIELLCWKTDQLKEQKIREFISDSLVYDLTAEVITECVSIRRKRRVKTPDAIIAATAICHNLNLITCNDKDFEGLKGLKLINPLKL